MNLQKELYTILHEEISEDYYDLSSLAKDSEELDAPVVKLIQSIFEDAIQVGASDIHIEPTDQGLRIRQRIDGILQGQVMKERDIAQPLSQRLKLMSKLDIAEKRLPQDGSFTIHAHNREIDVRLSTLPTPLGETVVMRLLNQNEAFFTSFETLGMPQAISMEFNRLVAQPHGVFLVTGPTGSGKSTTLYSVLSNMDCETRKIITIEDPIEYHLENVVQTQVLTKIDLSFARILRTTLRQDPDVLMVGEIRDEETATIAMRAALTGHMVFSTLHTNDSASTAIRLLDMGVEGFLVASALLGVLAQRLVRRICDGCMEDYQPTEQERLFVDAIADGQYSNISFKHGKGCVYCHHSGFKGRIGVFELLTLSPEMIEALRANNPAQFSKLAEQSLQGRLLLDNGLKQAQGGLTTIAEIMRMVGNSGL
ncbi:MAG: type II/IV secretion system protein [Gammaproteobacteria bacterium]|nr:type II/IV secretion system protein [Gammaproteobacteria bacterium]